MHQWMIKIYLSSFMCLLIIALCLQMKVAGKNLLNVCKLLFAVAKQEENDALFLEEQTSGT